MSSVLKALKKAEKEKSDASSPFIYSFLKGSEKKISYKGIKNVLFVVLLLSFVSSLLYLYDFNKRDNNIIEREPEIEKKVGQKNTEVSDISDIKEKPELQSRVIEYREPSSIFPVNRIEEPAQEEEIEIVAENQPRSEQEIFQETTPLPEKSMQDIQLNMISWTYDPNSRIAIINNIAMKEGEIKNGIKILKINIKDVVITHNNVKQVITFRSKKGLY